MIGDRGEDRPAGGSPREESGADGREREQRNDQAGGQTDPCTEHPTDSRWCFVLLHDRVAEEQRGGRWRTPLEGLLNVIAWPAV